MSRIALLCYNKLQLSIRCIQAVLDAGYPLSQLYIIDNGSETNFRPALLQSFPGIEILGIQDNCGFAGGFTRGLKQLFETHDCRSVLFLTNDTSIHPRCLEACEHTALETGAQLVAPCLMFRNDCDRIDSIGARFDRHSGSLHHCSRVGMPVLMEADEYIPGTALWLTRDAFESLGGTDESYVMYWEDVDFSFRAHRAGIRQARCYDAKIQHSIGQTCHKKPIYTTFYYQRNRIRFCRTWLTSEEWDRVKPTILSDLQSLHQKASFKNDTTRLQYLEKLFAELESHP